MNIINNIEMKIKAYLDKKYSTEIPETPVETKDNTTEILENSKYVMNIGKHEFMGETYTKWTPLFNLFYHEPTERFFRLELPIIACDFDIDFDIEYLSEEETNILNKKIAEGTEYKIGEAAEI